VRSRAVAGLLLSSCVGLLLAAAPASGVPSSATTLTNAMMRAGDSLGSSTLTTTYAISQVTARVSSAGLRLAGGRQYRASVCLNVHVLGTPPDAQCVTKDIDARSTSVTRNYALPTASRTVTRPPAGGAGYATQQIDVTYLSGTTWTAYGSSWPTGNIAAASLPLFAAGAAVGPLPDEQGVALESTLAHGGANTFLPDSMCISNPWPAATPRPDLSPTALGAMPFYYEVGAPSGAYATQPAKGVLLLFHGGGWYSNGGGAAEALRGEADRWRARGWRTVNSSYRPCGLTVSDALLLYDRVRATFGSTLPLCTFGHSAGGHVALMVAVSRSPGVRCVVDDAGPTDAATLPTQGAYDPAGGTQTNSSKAVYNVMGAAFGFENLLRYSPAQFAGSSLRGIRILAASAAQDSVVPYGQMTLLRDRMQAADPAAYVNTMQLPAGDMPFVHANVSQAALDAYHRAEQDLVAAFAP
jgi:acetyl esterase/lipase